MSLFDYENARVDAADRMGIRVSALDKIVDGLRIKSGKNEEDDLQGQQLSLPDIEPWHQPVDGAGLISDVTRAIQKHVILTEHQALATGLWAMHAHLLEVAEHSPRLHFNSPERRCGKSILLRTVAFMVPRMLSAENISTAALFRVIEMAQPTLLIDEVDSFLEVDNAESLRGLLNAGHTPHGTVIRVVGDDFEPRAFQVWGAVVLAGIGNIPATIEDRSITINLRRRKREEKIERLRRASSDQLKILGRRIARWAVDNRSALIDADPELPDELNDRAQDNWRPLIAVADRIGGDFGQKARDAAKALATEDFSEESNSNMALADVAAIFAAEDNQNKEWIPTASVVSTMNSLEERPWASYRRDGRGLTQNALARLLKPYLIFPRLQVPDPGAKKVSCYARDRVKEAAERYLEGDEPIEGDDIPF
jgi:putative DNA primase/helicase